MAEIVFYTSINAYYLPNARVLARSVKSIFPNCTMVLLFNDTTPANLSWANEPFDYVLFSHELNVPDFRRLAFSYSVVEFCTATKGAAAERLFAMFNPDYVIYLDPDCVAFSQFDELFKFMDAGWDVALTPHVTDAETSDVGINYHEIAALKHGTFNLGFIALRNTSRAAEFLKWWSDRCLRFAYIDFQRGIFTDQKWCNLAPYIFPGVGVFCDKSYNTATWNQKGRQLSRHQDGRWLVNGSPLRFYHFSGFGHDFAWASHEMESFPENAAALKTLWSSYGEALQKEKGHTSHPWYWGHFENGVPIRPADRQRYLLDPETRERFANPFSVECFRALRAN